MTNKSDASDASEIQDFAETLEAALRFAPTDLQTRLYSQAFACSTHPKNNNFRIAVVRVLGKLAAEKAQM